MGRARSILSLYNILSDVSFLSFSYYTKRAHGTGGDPRLAVLPHDLFREKRVLDIGCNEGVVTIEIGAFLLSAQLSFASTLDHRIFSPTRQTTFMITDSNLTAQFYAPSRIVGVDIDKHLIRLAWKRRRTSWSLQTASPSYGDSVSPSLFQPQAHQATDTSKKRKRRPSSPPATQSQPRTTSELENHPHSDYFPAAFEYMFGPIAFPPTLVTSQWPNNIAFYSTDWMKDQQEESFLEQENEKGWDVILACVLNRCAKQASISLSRLSRLSITKWIHLHGGDDGLLEFFRRVYRLLRPGGVFVLEPQEWEGYKNAKRMDRVSK